MYTYSEDKGFKETIPQRRFCVFFWNDYPDLDKHPLIYDEYEDLLRYLDSSSFRSEKIKYKGMTIEYLPVLFDWEV